MEMHPGGQDWTDPYGYRNPPSTQDVFDIVMAGDSYMNTGMPWTNSFPARLTAASGHSVYNAALPAHGPVLSLVRFVYDTRFQRRPPRLLVFGFVERDVQDDLFSGTMVKKLWIFEHPDRKRIHDRLREYPQWTWLDVITPNSLKTELPRSSAMAQAARKVFSAIESRWLGKKHPEVIVSDCEARPSMLFYRLSVERMRIGNEARDIPRVAWSLEFLRDFCQRRGMELLVLLIPDKAQVYRECLPADINEDEMPPSCLWALHEELAERNVHGINLLPVFREAAEEENLLYWRDDTHWNHTGIALAARTVAEYIASNDLINTSSGE